MEVMILGGPHNGEKYPNVRFGSTHLCAHGYLIPIAWYPHLDIYAADWTEKEEL